MRFSGKEDRDHPLQCTMRTLIELYDERPIENVLATEMFRPEETVFLCTPEIAGNASLQDALREYFHHRGVTVRLSFVPASILDAVRVGKTLRQVLDTHEDCCIDIAGGTDAALFAAGCVSGETPVITYSRKKNAFFEIRNAPFARNLPNPIRLDAASCFLMAGGQLLPGREDNAGLLSRFDLMDALFSVYTMYRRVWNRQISYIQRISMANDDSLEADGPIIAKADHGTVTAETSLLRALEQHGLIHDLDCDREHVHFRFADPMVRFWLRDMGSVLELQVFHACKKAGVFDDVILSAVVNWCAGEKRDAVTNEIDVMAVRGIQPVFISCKTCEIRTEALNELAILRDRFGGTGSRALIVTSASASRGRNVMRRRASELGIEVIEWEDVTLERLINRLKAACE